MVTVAEARQQLQAARARIVTREAQIAAAAIPKPTAAQVRQRGRERLQLEQLQRAELGRRKIKAREELIPVKKELSDFEKEVLKAEAVQAERAALQRDIEIAKKAARSTRPEAIFTIQTRRQRKLFRQFQENFQATQARIKSLQAINKVGLKAIFIAGKLVAFEDIVGKERIPIENLQILGKSRLNILKKAGIIQIPEVPTIEISPKIREPVTRRALAPTITTIELPPRKIIGRKITFGQPQKFGESFRKATGSESFTIAVPIRREDGKIRVQDFNFLFEDGKLVRRTPTGTALISEEQFLKVDKRRRDKNPGFTFGDTRLVTPIIEEIPIIPTRQKQLLELEKQGLTPIFVGGKLTGFEDRIGRQNIGVDQLNVIGIDRLRALEREGILTFQEIPISETIDLPPFTPLPQPKSRTLAQKVGNLLVGEEGKSLLRIGLITGVPGASISVAEFNQILRQTGLPGKVAAQFVPETPLEAAFFAGTAGLATAAGLTGKIAKGVLVGVGAATAASPSLPKEERIAGGIIAVAPLVPFLVRKGLRIGGKRGETSLSRFSELEQFFEKRKKQKSDLQNALDDFASQLKIKKVGKKVRDTTLQEKLSLVRKSVNEILKNPDGELRKAQAQGLVRLLKAELGEAKAKSLVNEFIAQEGLALRQESIGRAVVGNLRQESARFFIPLTVKDVKLIEKTTGITPPSVGVRLTPGETKSINTADFVKRQELTLEITTTQNRFKELLVQGAPQKTLERERQRIVNLTLQRSQTNQAFRQRLVQIQLLETRQIQREKLLLKQGLISKQKFQRLVKARARRVKIRGVRRRILFPKLKPIKKKPKVRLKAPPSEFGIFVRKRGKDIKIGTRKTRPSARKFLKKRLTTTLRASGFIVDKTGKKIRPKVTKGFRLSKIDPRRIVEKRGRRLDTKSEVKAIQAAKLKSTPMIKLKRKRK
ncbi:hypothetical protein LCGC14_0993950 [marine sediment metagenome]|uniref:Uncharacterized protein n=1 Tax=marine sediment metagenome TaxID=412755 RepID=A0A0F9N9L1_9ZZZZ